MNTLHTLIAGGTVVTAEGERRADVLVAGETVAAVGTGLDVPAGTTCSLLSTPNRRATTRKP